MSTMAKDSVQHASSVHETQRSQCTHREGLGKIKYYNDIIIKWVYIVLIKILFAGHLKHSSFRPLLLNPSKMTKCIIAHLTWGLTSAEGKKLECFKLTENNICITTMKIY